MTTAGSAHLIKLSEGHQLTIRRPQINNTSANSSYTLQGKTWTEGRSPGKYLSSEEPRSAAGILLNSHQEKRRGRGVHDSSQILYRCLSHWQKTCHCLSKLKKFNKMCYLYRNPFHTTVSHNLIDLKCIRKQFVIIYPLLCPSIPNSFFV